MYLPIIAVRYDEKIYVVVIIMITIIATLYIMSSGRYIPTMYRIKSGIIFN